MAQTKADLERECQRLREENDTLRFAMRNLLDANHHMSKAMQHSAASSKHAGKASSLTGDAMGLFIVPSIPNN